MTRGGEHQVKTEEECAACTNERSGQRKGVEDLVIPVNGVGTRVGWSLRERRAPDSGQGKQRAAAGKGHREAATRRSQISRMVGSS